MSERTWRGSFISMTRNIETAEICCSLSHTSLRTRYFVFQIYLSCVNDELFRFLYFFFSYFSTNPTIFLLTYQRIPVHIFVFVQFCFQNLNHFLTCTIKCSNWKRRNASTGENNAIFKINSFKTKVFSLINVTF